MADQRKMVDFPEREVKIGEQGTPVIVETEPRNVNSNAPIINDIKDLVKKEEEDGVETEDIHAKNIFASDEIEFSKASGDFGTNAKNRIKGALGDQVITNEIKSKTQVGGDGVMFAKLNPSGHQDNHWHIVNTKVDDTLYVYELEIAGIKVYDLSDIGSTATGDDLTNILKALASAWLVSYNGTNLKCEYYKPLQTAQTDDVVLVLQSAIFDNTGAVESLEKFTFTKQADGSMSVAHVSI